MRRGLYENGCYEADGVSILLRAVDSRSVTVACLRVMTEADYLVAAAALLEALNHVDPPPCLPSPPHLTVVK